MKKFYRKSERLGVSVQVALTADQAALLRAWGTYRGAALPVDLGAEVQRIVDTDSADMAEDVTLIRDMGLSPEQFNPARFPNPQKL